MEKKSGKKGKGDEGEGNSTKKKKNLQLARVNRLSSTLVRAGFSEWVYIHVLVSIWSTLLKGNFWRSWHTALQCTLQSRLGDHIMDFFQIINWQKRDSGVHLICSISWWAFRHRTSPELMWYETPQMRVRLYIRSLVPNVLSYRSTQAAAESGTALEQFHKTFAW